jgi:gibberellin 2-oxidase
MPSATLPEPPSIAKWKQPKHTTEELDWADIKVIDLSTFDEPNGKQKLAEELRDSASWQTLHNQSLY